jgi:hypothetical protein
MERRNTDPKRGESSVTYEMRKEGVNLFFSFNMYNSKKIELAVEWGEGASFEEIDVQKLYYEGGKRIQGPAYEFDDENYFRGSFNYLGRLWKIYSKVPTCLPSLYSTGRLLRNELKRLHEYRYSRDIQKIPF